MKEIIKIKAEINEIEAKKMKAKINQQNEKATYRLGESVCKPIYLIRG